MLISGRTWSQLFLCAVACAAQVRAFQSTNHTAKPAVVSAIVLGRVVEAGTNTPVINAIAALHTPSGDRIDAIRTSADGSFSFPRVPSGQWDVEVIKSGYERSKGRSVQVPVKPDDTGFIVALTKLARN
jgi:Carboxypeptidase regulatory-like domain